MDAKNDSQRVTVVNFDMPFGSMVMFMVKVALASIPALVILLLITALAIALAGGLGTLLSH